MESEKDWLRSGSLSFLIWKDHAEILTPVVTKIWKLSLETYTYQVHGRVQITNFSQKLRPQGNNDFRGIDITRVQLQKHWKRLCTFPSQFAYWEGRSCRDAFLSMQHQIPKVMDHKEFSAVKLFPMDFNK